MMNMLSPYMPASKFLSYVAWMKGRGVNFVNLALANEGNGEHAGYCLFGRNWDWTVDPLYRDHMLSRVRRIRKQIPGYVPWALSDDSRSFNRAALSDPDRYMRDLRASGLLVGASMFCMGIEFNEYGSPSDARRMVAAARKVFNRPIAMHQSSGRYDYFLYSKADVCAYQVDPGRSAEWLVAEARRVKAAIGGKPLWMFEIEREPARSKCEALLGSGVPFSVGNW
jgi:hypothetical protein